MNNYYDILEVSQKASKEIIEKAYKVLAKKYHPDLQETSNKSEAENKMKLINEAYDVLSNDEKRKEYDEQLKREEEQKRLQEEQVRARQTNTNNMQQSSINYNQQQTNNYNRQQSNYNYTQNQQPYHQNYVERPLTKEEIKAQKKAEKKARREYQEEQERIYYNYWRSLGYHVKERWTWRKTKILLKIIGIAIIIMLILWILPPTHKIMTEIYENNKIIRTVINIITSLFRGLRRRNRIILSKNNRQIDIKLKNILINNKK